MSTADRPPIRFRPTLWPTVVSVAGVVVLLALGTWQIQRLHWKNEPIDTRAAALAAPPLSLTRLSTGGEAYPYRRIRISGTFIHDREMYLVARTYRRRVGVQVVTPLRLDDRSHILVNRGWVPEERKDPAARPTGQVPGDVSVVGILRIGGRKSGWIPDNQPDDGVWHYVDLAAMAKAAGLPTVRRYVIEAGPAPNPGGYPIGGQTRTVLSNDHLQYAVTWYTLAIALAAVYVAYHLRRRDGSD